jgi:chromosome segregation ATPase
MVKFRRNEPLAPLSSTTHSGGERSVCTMIYMMSMQELTKVPFRCVDEINQGMDASNEKRVFEVLTSLAKNSKSQYILLTPKVIGSFREDVGV